MGISLTTTPPQGGYAPGAAGPVYQPLAQPARPVPGVPTNAGSPMPTPPAQTPPKAPVTPPPPVTPAPPSTPAQATPGATGTNTAIHATAAGVRAPTPGMTLTPTVTNPHTGVPPLATNPPPASSATGPQSTGFHAPPTGITLAPGHTGTGTTGLQPGHGGVPPISDGGSNPSGQGAFHPPPQGTGPTVGQPGGVTYVPPGTGTVPPQPVPGVAQGPAAPGQAASTPNLNVPTTQFSNSSNLIGTQLNPTASPIQNAYQGATAGAAAGLGSNPFSNLTQQSAQQLAHDPQTAALQQMTLQAAQGLDNVDPVALAQQQFNTFQSQEAPAYAASLRQATQLAAANGGIGSGMLNTQYGNLALQNSRDLQNEQQTLLENALNTSIAEQQNKASELGGLAQSSAGINSQQAQTLGALGQSYNQQQNQNVGTLAGLEGQQFGQGQTNLQDEMQQQQYQEGLSQQAIQNQAAEYAAEQAAQNQQFQQSATEAGIGYAGNPSATQQAIGAEYGQEANQSYADSGALLGNYAYQQALQGGQAVNTTDAQTMALLNQLPGLPGSGATINPGAGLNGGNPVAGTGPGALPTSIPYTDPNVYMPGY